RQSQDGTIPKEFGRIRRGQLAYSDDMGRWVFNSGDFFRGYSASGGSDWDDTFDAILRYDPKTKRALRQVIRNPNALGEYQWYDAHLATDPNLPREVKALYAEIMELNQQVLRKNSPKSLKRLVDKIDKKKMLLDDYFSG